jgi:hypothetical protein
MSPARIREAEKVERLARAIAADVRLYNAAAVERARATGVVPAELTVAIAEGRELFLARVDPGFAGREDYYARTIDERVLGTAGAR